MAHLHVNYLAIVVAALAAFALGALWYSPLLFAKQWVKAHGYSEAQLQAMQKKAPKAYGVSLACFVVLAFALAVLLNISHITAVLAGVKLGLLCWAGFAATLGLTAHVYSDKPIAAYLIDAGYQLVYFLLMALILVAWR